MSLARQILHEFRPLFRLLDEPFGRAAGAPAYRQRALFDDPLGAILPAVDVTEEGDKYIVEADLPGVQKEDVEVRIGDGGRSVVIEGKTKRAANDASKTQATELAVERVHPGSAMFARTVWLPRPVDSARVSARLQDGVLTLTVPKAEETEGVRVDVE